MKIGFLTACLGQLDLDELVPWAARQGFDALELAAWPAPKKGTCAPRHVDASGLTSDDAARISDLFAEHGIRISALAYYDNNLHPDPKRRAACLAHLRHVIHAASLLGVDRVGTFVGGRPTRPARIMREIGAIFREMAAFAEDRGVRLMIENCPMENWVTFGLPGNFAYSPELWDALFNEVPNDNFGLNFDPSHLYWLGIDHLKATRDYATRIFHVHAKDTEILPAGRDRFGILSEQLGNNVWHSGWWRYRMPGRGGIDWRQFLDELREVGYEDVVSIEHEDPDFEGSEEKIKQGLCLGLSHLEGCAVAVS